MKQFLLLCLICHLCSPLHAQVATSGTMMAGSSTVREKLVELALQNPDLEIADHQVNVAKYRLKEAKGWWADNISLSFNANEFTIKRLQGEKQDNGQYYPFYPFYNVGVTVPIGSFFSKPAATKAAREQVAIAQASRSSKFNQIKAAVLSAYENYLANRQLLTVQSQITESAYNDFLQAKEKFRNGQISVDDYNKAAQQYHDQIISSIGAEHDLNLTRIQLEALIGVPLSSILPADGRKDATVPSDSSAVSR